MGLARITAAEAAADAGRLRRRHRRALAGRIRRGPPARRRQLAGARRRAAPHRRHAVQAGLAASRRASVGAAMVARNIADHLGPLDRRHSRATGGRWSTAGAAASARARWPGCWTRSAFARRSAAKAATGRSAVPCCADLETLPQRLRLPRAVRPHRLRQDAGCCRRWPRSRRAGAGPGRPGLPPRLGARARCPGSRSPAQKAFETQLWQALRGFDPARPVFVEGESRTIGRLRVPEALLAAAARTRPCVQRRRCRWRRGVQLAAARTTRHFVARRRQLLRAARRRCASCAAATRSRAGRPRPAPGAWAEVFAELMHAALRPALRALDAAQLSPASPQAHRGRPARRRRRPRCSAARAPAAAEPPRRCTPLTIAPRRHRPRRQPPMPSDTALEQSRRLPAAPRSATCSRSAGWPAAGATCCAARCRACCTAWRTALFGAAAGGAGARPVLAAGRRLQRLPAGGAAGRPPACTPSAARSKQRQRPTWPTALAAWRPRDGRLVMFGLLLALAGTGWVLTSASLITALRRRAGATARRTSCTWWC